MSGPVSTILSLPPACPNKLTSSLFSFKKEILLHGSEVGISTLTVVAELKCHKFWVTLVPAASKPGSIPLRHKLGLQQNVSSQTKPRLVNVTTNALRKDETIPVLTQIQSTLESKVTFSFRWAEVAEQHTAHQNIKCSLLPLSLLPSSPRHSWAKMSLSSKSHCLSPRPPFCHHRNSPTAPWAGTDHLTTSHSLPPSSLTSCCPPLGTWPQTQGPYTIARETLLQTSCEVANYCW